MQYQERNFKSAKKVKRPFKAGVSVTAADVNNSIIIQKRHTRGSYAALFLGPQLQDVLLLSGTGYCFFFFS